jgi:hypothetical protein
METMQTYTMLDHTVLNLDGLTADERAFLDHAVASYRAGMGYDDFDVLISDHGANPLLRAHGGWGH